MDGDGRISKHDLKLAFRSMQRDLTDEDADEWVSKRDSTGTGGVNLVDFIANYG